MTAIHTRVFLLLVAVVAVASVVHAQAPARDLTIVAPAAPGGGWDQTARAMQQVFRATGLAASIQVVNTAGAAGTIGLARFVNSEAGHSNALLVTGLVMVSGIVTNNSPVTLAHATPIARLSGEYEVIVVPASSPYKTLADLVAAFRANPRSVSWGGGSAGGTDEILIRMIAAKVGVTPDGANYIAYSGGGQALASVLGAHVSAAVSGLGEFGSQIESGALRALAISSDARLPNSTIPTLREQGVDVVLLNWRGIVAPPGITRAERASLIDLTRRMATSPEWKGTMARAGWADIYMEGDAFARFITDETRRVAPIVASAGRKANTDWFELFIGLGLLSAALAVALERWNRRAAAPSTNPERAQRAPAENGVRAPAEYMPLAMLALALIIDAALINWIGFILASAMMFTLTARAFGSQRVVRDIVVGLVLAAVVQIGFTRGLGVALPLGVFG
ncbi:MAG: tripartite tricarboxylate transporter substrate-binding protein [Gemmatimonadota bacterium]